MKNRISYKWHSSITPWLFILPTLVGLIVFRLIPIGASFYLSFTDWNLLSQPQWIGLGNYSELIREGEFATVVLNTLQFSFIFVAGSMILGLALAVMINVHVHGISVFRAMIYLPVVTSNVAIGIIWNWMLGPTYGIVCNIIETLGMTPPYFLSDPKLALTTVAMVHMWKMSGYYMILFLTGLQNVPTEVLESAYCDGANNRQTFFKITLPMLKPTVFFVLTIALIDSFKNFELIYSMTKGGPGISSTTLVYDVYLNAFQFYRVGYASAVSFILLLFVGAFTIFNFWIRKHHAQPLD